MLPNDAISGPYTISAVQKKLLKMLPNNKQHSQTDSKQKCFVLFMKIKTCKHYDSAL